MQISSKSSIIHAVILSVITYAVYILGLKVTLNLDLLNPINKGLGAFKSEIEDTFMNAAFATNDFNVEPSDIYIFDIESLDREGIASALKYIYKLSPRTIGIDILFSKQQPNDHDLELAIKHAPCPLISACLLPTSKDGNLIEKATLITSHLAYNSRFYGFANFPNTKCDATIRYFLPKVNGINAFAVEVVKKSAPNIYQKFLENLQYRKDYHPEVLKYSRNRTNTNIIRSADLKESNIELKNIKDKIVLFGYVGKNSSDEDMHRSTFNMFRFNEDMSGVEIHANIIEMILKERYIKHPHPIITHMLSFILNFLFYLLLSRSVITMSKKHIKLKILQLTAAVLIILLSWVLLKTGNIWFDYFPALLCTGISVDIAYIYFDMIKHEIN